VGTEAGERASSRKNMEVAYIEALNVGLLGERESKGLIRDRALLEEAERLNRSAGSVSTVPPSLQPTSRRATIPPPSWKQSRG
jgi:hypothetical protein